MEPIEFKVGEKYENVKGVYEVLSIDGDIMRIRWESGEEITTEIDFQKRIIERIQEEQELLNHRKNAARKRSAFQGSQFEGFTDDDFSGHVTGSTWRRRTGIGGAVSFSSSATRLNIKSWSVARKPMVQWADVQHRKEYGCNIQGKFFVSLDPEQLEFGFCLERSGKMDYKTDEFELLMKWLKNRENEDWLKALAEKEDLAVFDARSEGDSSGKLVVRNGKWCLVLPEKVQDVDSLSVFMKDAFNSSTVELHIAKHITKVQVLDAGAKIAEDISSLFEMLIPLYEHVVFTG
jgi:hypothetical protein